MQVDTIEVWKALRMAAKEPLSKKKAFGIVHWDRLRPQVDGHLVTVFGASPDSGIAEYVHWRLGSRHDVAVRCVLYGN